MNSSDLAAQLGQDLKRIPYKGNHIYYAFI